MRVTALVLGMTAASASCNAILGNSELGPAEPADARSADVTPDARTGEAGTGEAGRRDAGSDAGREAGLKYVTSAAGSTMGDGEASFSVNVSSVKRGDLLVAAFGWSGRSEFAVTDTFHSNWTMEPVVDGPATDYYVGMAFALAGDSGMDTVTLAPDGSASTYYHLFVLVFRGANTVDALNSSCDTATQLSLPLTTTYPNEVVVGWPCVNGGPAPDPGLGFHSTIKTQEQIVEYAFEPEAGVHDITASLPDGAAAPAYCVYGMSFYELPDGGL